MNCDEVGRMIEAYLDGELDLTGQLDVETHSATSVTEPNSQRFGSAV
jgi:hypothetical protein